MSDLGDMVADQVARQFIGCAALAALVGLLVGALLVWVIA